MQYLLWRLASALLGRLPVRGSYAFASFCGWAAFTFSPRMRRNTLRNFRQVMPGAPIGELRRAARASIANYCCYLVDFARLPSLDDRQLQALCARDRPFVELQRALCGRGAVVVPMHFGSWDTGAAVAAVHGLHLTVAGDRFGDDRLDRLVFGARERLGMTVVSAENAAPSLLRTLKRGGIVVLLVDKPTPGSGVTVPFFGRPVDVPAGPARLALRSGAALVPVAFPRLRANAPEVDAFADFSIDACPRGDVEADVIRLTGAVMAAHERYIRSYPEQWYMFREMWPAGERP